MSIREEIIRELGGFTRKYVERQDKKLRKALDEVETLKKLFAESQGEVKRLSDKMDECAMRWKRISADVDTRSMPSWVLNNPDNLRDIVGAKAEKELLKRLEAYIERHYENGIYTVEIVVAK